MPSEDLTYTLALDLPKAMALGPPMFFIMRRERYCPRATKITMGRIQVSRKLRMGSVCWMTCPENSAPESFSICFRSGSGIMPVE